MCYPCPCTTVTHVFGLYSLNCLWSDCVIATIALEHGYRIYSQDKHFKAIAEILPIQLYTPSYIGMYNPD